MAHIPPTSCTAARLSSSVAGGPVPSVLPERFFLALASNPLGFRGTAAGCHNSLLHRRPHRAARGMRSGNAGAGQHDRVFDTLIRIEVEMSEAVREAAGARTPDAVTASIRFHEATCFRRRWRRRLRCVLSIRARRRRCPCRWPPAQSQATPPPGTGRCAPTAAAVAGCHASGPVASAPGAAAIPADREEKSGSRRRGPGAGPESRFSEGFEAPIARKRRECPGWNTNNLRN